MKRLLNNPSFSPTLISFRKVRDIDPEGIFKTVEKKITRFFADDKLLFDPGAMEGYLYVDHHYEDDFFESEAFCEYTIAFVQQLSFEEKTTYILQLDQALCSHVCTAFWKRNLIQDSKLTLIFLDVAHKLDPEVLHDEIKFVFFKKNRKLFPVECEAFFLIRHG